MDAPPKKRTFAETCIIRQCRGGFLGSCRSKFSFRSLFLLGHRACWPTTSPPTEAYFKSPKWSLDPFWTNHQSDRNLFQIPGMYFTRYMRRVPQLVYHSQVGRNPVHLWIAITCKSPKYEGILLLATLPWSGISLILGCWSPMWSIISNTNNHLISSANRQGWSLTLNASISGKHETMKSLYFYSLVPLGFNMFPPFIFFSHHPMLFFSPLIHFNYIMYIYIYT